MPPETTKKLFALLEECNDTFQYGRKPEQMANNLKAFVYALQFFDEDKIIMAFRTWQCTGKKYPLPADISGIIKSGNFHDSVKSSVTETWPEWKNQLKDSIGEAVVTAWFKNAKKNRNVLTLDSPFKARWVEAHYFNQLKKIGITEIKAS